MGNRHLAVIIAALPGPIEYLQGPENAEHIRDTFEFPSADPGEMRNSMLKALQGTDVALWSEEADESQRAAELAGLSVSTVDGHGPLKARREQATSFLFIDADEARVRVLWLTSASMQDASV